MIRNLSSTQPSLGKRTRHSGRVNCMVCKARGDDRRRGEALGPCQCTTTERGCKAPLSTMWYSPRHDQALRPHHRPTGRTCRACRHLDEDAAALHLRAPRRLGIARWGTRTRSKTHADRSQERRFVRCVQRLRTSPKSAENLTSVHLYRSNWTTLDRALKP